MGKAGSALDSSAGKQSNSCPFRAYPHQMRSAQWSGSWQNGEANRFYSISACCTFNL
jgi:ribosome modulation factor